MSHFLCIAFLPKATTDIENTLQTLMEPYYEGREVPGYERECDCAKWQAKDDARKQTSRELGSFEVLRTSFVAKVAADPVLAAKDKEDPFDGTRDEWQEYIRPWIERENAVFLELMKTAKPLLDCDECRGTGHYTSTYNPDSHYDWYQIGGRWTGYLEPSYNPTEDPENVEVCPICHGSGVRHDFPIFAEGMSPFDRAADGEIARPIRHETRTCNGCDGKGSRQKWPTDWKKFSGDITHASKVVELIESDPKKYVPFAYLTPDGVWHEKGELWAVVDNKLDSWATDSLAKFKELAEDCVAVVCDCHI